MFLITADQSAAVLYTGEGVGDCGDFPTAPRTTAAEQHSLVAWTELSRSGHTALISYSLDCDHYEGTAEGHGRIGQPQTLDIMAGGPFGNRHCPGPLAMLKYTLGDPNEPITHKPFGVLGS